MRSDTLMRWSGPVMTTIIANMICASLALAQACPPHTLVDDSAIKIRSVADVSTMRRALVQYIWGTSWSDVLNKQPSEKYDSYTPVPSDALPDTRTLANLDRIEKIVIQMDLSPARGGTRRIKHISTAYLFHPHSPNGRVVIVHHGHGCALDGSDGPYNLDRTIRDLLQLNYAVVGMRMPLYQRPSECGHDATTPLCTTPRCSPHDGMFSDAERLQTGSPLQFFLEPVAKVLNYIQRTYPNYHDFNIVGLPGGGWTASVYPAIDPRIVLGFNVAGSAPLYRDCSGGSGSPGMCHVDTNNRDSEQYVCGLYSIAGFKDLYVLDSYGANRRQTQILNHDGVFWPAPVDESWAPDVQLTLATLGCSGSFVFDEDLTTTHQISLAAIAHVILPTLRDSSAVDNVFLPTLQAWRLPPANGRCSALPVLLKWLTW